MVSRLLLATAFIAASSTLALAQANPPPKPGAEAPGMTAPDAGNPPPPPPPDARGGPHRWAKHGWRHHGGRGGKGFMLSLGDGVMLKVDCGDEPLKGCIDAAAPLVDQLGATDMDEPSDEMQAPDTDAPDTPGAEPAYPSQPPTPPQGGEIQ